MALSRKVLLIRLFLYLELLLLLVKAASVFILQLSLLFLDFTKFLSYLELQFGYFFQTYKHSINIEM